MPILISLLLACAGGTGSTAGIDTATDTGTVATTADGGMDGGSATVTDTGTALPPPPTLSFSLSRTVMDPLRSDPLALTATIWPTGRAVTLDMEITDAKGAVVVDLAQGIDPGVAHGDPSTQQLRLFWDGRDGDAQPLPTGTYTASVSMLDATDTLDSQSIDLYVVRTGLLSGTWGGSGRDDDVRVPLLWYKSRGASPYWDDGATEAAFRLGSVTRGEGIDETATTVPEVWNDLEAPPEGWADVNLPVGYQYDSHPVITLLLGNDLGDAADALSWTATAEGWDLLEGSVAEGRLVFARADKLGSSIGIVDDSLTLVLQADSRTVMTQDVPYRAYALMGPATFASGGSPQMAWVSAVDQALRGIDGVEATDTAILNALIDWVYTESGLRYDTVSGASFYMSYSGSWSSGRFNFRSFLDRTNGNIVNCSDCSGIIGVFANMLGVPLDYSIILSNFSLNEIKAIGVDDYTSCPFGPYSCGFSYHAVTTNDLSATIWDATLELDGDKDPGSEPWTELMVQSVPGTEYLDRLVRSGTAGYYYDDSRVSIQ